MNEYVVVARGRLEGVIEAQQADGADRPHLTRSLPTLPSAAAHRQAVGQTADDASVEVSGGMSTMAYVLNALIARTGSVFEHSLGAKSVPLRLNFELFPLTSAFWASLNSQSLPVIREAEAGSAPNEEFERVGERNESLDRAIASRRSLFALLGSMSSSCSIAYVEAEFWGGSGVQAGAVWRDGALIWGPAVEDKAINRALSHLGVVGDVGDEFATLQLGRYRSTEQWIR
jgi:hypothetical protein